MTKQETPNKMDGKTKKTKTTSTTTMMLFVVVLVLFLLVEESAAYPKGSRPSRNANSRARWSSKPPTSVPWRNYDPEAHSRVEVVKPLSLNSTNLRVLALDGGGIRGLLSSRILVAVEKKIQVKTGDPSAKIGDYFDVISGTSVGGIAALALMSGYNASQITEIWYNNADNIFGSAMQQWFGPSIDSAYNPTGLEQVLRHYLGNTTRMTQAFSERSFAIVSFDSAFSGSAVFTRQSTLQNGDFYSWQVGRATSAAPTYFPTAFISSLDGRNFTFIDGGVMANDPALIALSVAAEDYPGVTLNSTVLLSVGTGITDAIVEGYHDWGYEPWFMDGDIIDLIFNGPMYAVEDTVSRLFRQAASSSRYLRVQYSQNQGINGDLLSNCQKADFALDNVEPRNLDLLILCGDQIATAYSSSLDKIVDLLIQKK